MPFPYLDIAPEPLIAYLLYWLFIGMILLFIFGYKSRIVAPIVFLFFTYHWMIYMSIFNTAFDRLNLIFLFIMMFGDLDAAWSISSKGKNSPRDVEAWCPTLLKLQLALLYLGAGLWKLFNPWWHSGNVLKHNFIGAYASSFWFWIESFQPPGIIYHVLAFGTILFELFAGFGLFYKRTRNYVIFIGILFHLGNTFILYIPEFLNCIMVYVLFMEESTLRNIGNKLIGYKTILFQYIIAK